MWANKKYWLFPLNGKWCVDKLSRLIRSSTWTLRSFGLVWFECYWRFSRMNNCAIYLKIHLRVIVFQGNWFHIDDTLYLTVLVLWGTHFYFHFSINRTLNWDKSGFLRKKMLYSIFWVIFFFFVVRYLKPFFIFQWVFNDFCVKSFIIKLQMIFFVVV